jgi:hypothetical protein
MTYSFGWGVPYRKYDNIEFLVDSLVAKAPLP